MIGLEFNPPDLYINSMYCMNKIKESIMIGTDLDRLSKKMFKTHRNYVKESLREFSSLKELAEKKTERSLTHESIHVVIYRLEGWGACLDFEFIDHNYEISDFLQSILGGE